MRWRGLVVAVLVAVSLLGLWTSRPAAADDGDALEWGATLDGVDLTALDAGQPLVVGPAAERPFVLTVTNTGTAPVTIRSIRLEGRVMGLAFISYTTRLQLVLTPQESTERRFDMYFDDVTQQARGLLPSNLILIGPDGERLGVIQFPMKIEGSVFSVYSVFGMAVAGATLVLIGTLLLSIRQGRLPENRWRRGVWFLPAGAGLGLTLTFTLSSLSLLTPGATSWATLVLICSSAAFLIGYFWIRGAGLAAEDDLDEQTGGDVPPDEADVPVDEADVPEDDVDEETFDLEWEAAEDGDGGDGSDLTDDLEDTREQPRLTWPTP